MKRTLLFALAILAVASAGSAAEEKGTTYGAGVKLTTTVKVADLLAQPDQFVGKTVRVDGIVRAVCQEMGCWIQIADAEKTDGIQFKVADGVIVFPKDAKGKRASAEGTFERMPGDDKHAAEHAKEATAQGATPEHHAHGAAAEDATKPAPLKAPEYWIKATGAIVY